MSSEERQYEEFFNGLNWLVINERDVRRAYRRYSKGDPYLEDELWSVCVDKAQACMDTWDPDKGASLRTHMLNNLRLYCFKYFTDMWKRNLNLHRFTQAHREQDLQYTEWSDIDVREILDILKSKLTDFEWWILTEYYCEGKTHKEIHREYKFDVGESSVRNYRRAALARAKELLRTEPSLRRVAALDMDE